MQKLIFHRQCRWNLSLCVLNKTEKSSIEGVSLCELRIGEKDKPRIQDLRESNWFSCAIVAEKRKTGAYSIFKESSRFY